MEFPHFSKINRRLIDLVYDPFVLDSTKIEGRKIAIEGQETSKAFSDCFSFQHPELAFTESLVLAIPTLHNQY